MVRGKMTGLFKCVVLSCAVPLIFGLTSVRDDANWFKNGQKIKNRFVTGVVNGIVDFDCNDSINGENVEGECLSKVECTKTGGKVGGLCSLLGSCCVIEKTCSQTTHSKLSYFVTPSKIPTECPLTVKIYSKDVCQIRLDFEKFDIAEPTSELIKVGEETVNTSYQCRDDSFVVENGQRNLGFEHLCGANEKQHVYIPVGENQQQIILKFYLRSRNETRLQRPEWRIKIRQLECGRSGYEQLLNAPSKLMAMYQNLKNKKKSNSDYELIAPHNCLQYYPKKEGTFESFNYNGGKGHYIGNLRYSICFGKAPEICGAKFQANGVFQMNSNRYDAENEQEQCNPSKDAGPKTSRDYLWIPQGFDGSKYKDYYCDRNFNNRTVSVKRTGPLLVTVNTDGLRPNVQEDVPEEVDEYAEVGFRIHYALQSDRCDTRF